MSVNAEAKEWLDHMKAHTDCCGTPIVRKLVAESDKMLLAIANLSVMSPNYSDGKFEDHAAFIQRMKQYARDCLAALE